MESCDTPAPPTTKGFKIHNAMASFVGEKFAQGTYLVCNVFSEWDTKGKKFAKVKLRGNYWIGNFSGHICSVRHNSNCMKKS